MTRLMFPALLGLATLVTGCATLTKSQVQAVNQYATLTSDGSAYPGQVLTPLISAFFDGQLLTASQNVSETNPLTFDQLVKLNGEKQAFSSSIGRINAGVEAISQYAQALQRLSSPDLSGNLTTAGKALGGSLDDLIDRAHGAAKPTSTVGGLLAKLVSEAGGRYVSYRQTKAIRQYVNAGDTLVDNLTRMLEATLTEHAAPVLTAMRGTFAKNTNDLLRQVRMDAPYERYQLATNSLAAVTQFDQIDRLTTQSVRALQRIRSAHAELRQTLSQKQDVATIGHELLALYQAVHELETSFQTVKL